MFTISCYDVHPVAAKLEPIWRWAQTATDWLVYMVTRSCCRCGGGPVQTSTTTDKDTIDTYRSNSQMMTSSSPSEILEPAEPRRRPPAHSDTELALRNKAPLDSSPDRLVTTDSGYSKTSHLSMSSGLSLDIEDAGGEPHGQLILDYNSTIGDTETNNSVTLQLLGMTSDSETGFAELPDCGATGDHNQCTLSLYSHGSETDVDKTQPSNYGSSRENMSSGSYEQTSQDETKSSQKTEEIKYYDIPPGYELSSKASDFSLRSLQAPMSEPILEIAHSNSTVHSDAVKMKSYALRQSSLGDRTVVVHTLQYHDKLYPGRFDTLIAPKHIRKGVEQEPLMTAPPPRGPSGKENNLPAVHTTRKDDKGFRPELPKL